MCRWLAYSGSPVLLEDLLYKPTNSLVMQSKHSRWAPKTTNGDGFGVGWYGARRPPGCSAAPSRPGTTATCASCPRTPSAGRVFAHIRASTGSAVQQTNCHPFRHGSWLWMHNGYIAGVPRDEARPRDGGGPGALRRHRGIHRLRDPLLPRPDLRAARRPARRPWPARWGWSRRWAAATASSFPVQMTVATTDGDTTWAFRYSSEGQVALAVPQHRRRRPCARSTRTTRCCTTCRTTRGSWSPSRSATWPGPGARSPRPRACWCTAPTTSWPPSRRSRPEGRSARLSGRQRGSPGRSRCSVRVPSSSPPARPP